MERVLGVEHEYRVVAPDGTVVDMRTIIDDLPFDGRRVDPGDPHAVRCRWGGVITADGAEAEIATPPEPLRPGSTDALRASLDAGQAALLEALHTKVPAAVVEGYSTHISMEVGDRRTARCGKVVVRRFAPALMLLTDRRSSPGLLVRPRRHRLELCGEHVEGEDLAAALVFAAAVVVAVDRSLRRPLRARHLPPAVALEVVPAVERFGWYVDRGAGGADLYERGRTTPLRAGRAWVRAGDHLAQAWESVRPLALEQATSAEVALVDARVDGSVPLPCERG